MDEWLAAVDEDERVGAGGFALDAWLPARAAGPTVALRLTRAREDGAFPTPPLSREGERSAARRSDAPAAARLRLRLKLRAVLDRLVEEALLVERW